MKTKEKQSEKEVLLFELGGLPGRYIRLSSEEMAKNGPKVKDWKWVIAMQKHINEKVSGLLAS